MYRVTRFIMIGIILVTAIPVHSEPNQAWVWRDYLVLCSGLAILLESVITLIRKGRVGRFQALLGLSGYIVFLVNWLLTVISRFPMKALQTPQVPHRTTLTAGLVVFSLIVVACGVLNMKTLLPAFKGSTSS